MIFLRRAASALLLLALLGPSFLGAFAPPAAALPVPLATYSLDPIAGLEYVAIAPLAWADLLQPLIDWKNEKGVPAQVFPLEYIISPPDVPRDDAKRLHNWLADLHFNRAPSTKWLLLVGDGDWDYPIMPLREVFTNSQQDGNLNNSGNWYTTDTYFGNLESSWDEDGDGIFGELNEGDWTPELYVGRVPVDNPGRLITWVSRQVEYEKNPPEGLWMRRGVLAGALMDRPNVLDDPFTAADEGYDPFTDNAREVNEAVAAVAPSWMQLDHFYDYPFVEGGQYTPATDSLVTGALKGAIDGGASFVLIEGHGYTSNSGVAQYADPTGTKSIWRTDTEDPALRFEEVLNLTNGAMLPFVYVSACYAGDFTDRDDTSFEAFLEAPSGGAIAVVAGNGENFRLENISGQQAFGNWWLAHEFFSMLFEEGYSQPGRVLGDLKARYNSYYLAEGPTDAVSRNYFRAERVSYNLMGDPEFSLITDIPAALNAGPLRQPLVGENAVQVLVTGRGGALPGALVHLTGPAGDFRARTNATGVATLPYPVTDTSTLNLTVTAPNHVPLRTSAVPAVPERNLGFSPPSLAVSGTLQRGQTLTVSGSVTAAALTPFANVVVQFRMGNPTDGALVSAIVLPQVAGGAVVPFSVDLELDASGDYLVYATIDPAGDLTEDTTADNVAFASIHINSPPVFSSMPTLMVPAGGIVADALQVPSYVLDRESGPAGLTYRVASVSDPNLTALLSGSSLSLSASPNASGTVDVAIEVSDGLDIARGHLSVLILRSNLPPVIVPVLAAAAEVGRPFSLNLSALDPEGATLVWTDSSTLVDVSLAGRIAFTPTAAQVGRHAVTVTASDGALSASHTFLLVIDEREDAIEVANLPVLRASPGHEVAIDLNQISDDPEVLFVTDRQDVVIDQASRILRYTPAAGEPRLETIRLTASKPGLPTTQVVVRIDVAGQVAGGAPLDAIAFFMAGLGAAGAVGLTLLRAHERRVREEKIFKIKGRPPKAGKRPAPDRAARRRKAGEEE